MTTEVTADVQGFEIMSRGTISKELLIVAKDEYPHEHFYIIINGVFMPQAYPDRQAALDDAETHYGASFVMTQTVDDKVKSMRMGENVYAKQGTDYISVTLLDCADPRRYAVRDGSGAGFRLTAQKVRSVYGDYVVIE